MDQTSTHPLARRLATTLLATLVALLTIVPVAAHAAPMFGTWSPGEPYNSKLSGVDALQNETGRRVDIVNWYQSWGGGDWVQKVQPEVIQTVTGSGRIPLLTWEAWDPAKGTNQPDFSLARIASGGYDAYIAGWARGLAAQGSTIYLRPFHEMNGNWYPWGGSVNGNSAADFVAAWRHMVTIFRSNGAGNVRFVWSPNNTDVPSTPANRMENYYPGTAFVDVLAVDGYNWGARKPEFGGWNSFSKVFQDAYDRLKALGPQPIWIAEVGSAPEGGDKAAWVRDMFARANAMDRLQAIVWFNENKEADWRANTVAAAFRPGAEQLSGEGAAAGAGAGAGTAKASRSARGRARLVLRSAARVARGRSASVRWRLSGATASSTKQQVARWVVFLDGRKVRTVSRRAMPVMRKRIFRSGTHRWKVEGRSATGRRVLQATRAFRVR